MKAVLALAAIMLAVPAGANIAPGRPGGSILTDRTASTGSGIAMPEPWRNVPRAEGMALICGCIAAMPAAEGRH